MKRLEIGTGQWSTIAVDPLEELNLCANNMPGVYLQPCGSGGCLRHISHAPDCYMQKLRIGPGYPPGTIDLDASDGRKYSESCEGKGRQGVRRLRRYCSIDRGTLEIITAVRKTGDICFLLSDGDVAGVIQYVPNRRRVLIFTSAAAALGGCWLLRRCAASVVKCKRG